MSPELLSEILAPGEVVKHSARPSFRIYVQRLIFVMALLALCLTPIVLWLQDPRAWIIVPMFLLIDLFLFDNLEDWIQTRRLAWMLTDRRVIEIDTSTGQINHSAPITEIARVRRLMWWGLNIVSEDRDIIEIAFVPALGDLRRQIISARKAIL